MNTKRDRERIGIPPRMFFYTPDQIATLLELDIKYVETTLLFYEKREPGIVPKNRMRAVNIAPEGETPIWRVSEITLIQYLREKVSGFMSAGTSHKEPDSGPLVVASRR